MVVASALGIVAPALPAQFVVRSTLPWRTIETEHFAFHYPVELETWTRDLASRIESVDSAVARVVGGAPAAKTHIVVDDPYEIANGSAWPFVDQPVINLWASPPTPREDIGEFREWGEMLVSHEFAHIAHLTRPSRNPFVRRLWQVLPANLGPIAIEAPRWVIEGYATFVEGRVTGSGRPHGAWRAALLREWALEGQLPRYEQLDASPGFEGGEFAYLAGSAFLEWLVERPGQSDASLTALWRRMSARQTRGFDEAFEGVFGESPRALYGHFVVDVTSRSLDVVRGFAAGAPFTPADTGTIIQRLALGTGDPAISADGKRVALVLRSQTMPSRVVVWSTASEPDTGKARRDSILLARDPLDVPARPIYPPAKKTLQSIQSPGGSPYEAPRFLRDGRVLLSRNTAMGDGTLRTDLYRWNPGSNAVERVTHGASLHEADPLPSGRSAVATQCRRGWCDIVVVSLDNGAVRPLLSGSPTRSFYRPRVSPTGDRFIVAVHRGPAWTLAVGDTSGSTVDILSPDDAGDCYDASWQTSGRIVAVCNGQGIPNLMSYDLAAKRWSQLTRVTGAAVAPVENPADSSIWFLSLYSRGYDVRRIPIGAAQKTAVVAAASTMAPAVPEAIPAIAPRFSRSDASAPRPFGLAPRSLRWFANPQADADAIVARVGLVSMDVIGRSELLANGVFGDASGWRGGSVDAVWRGFQPALHLQAFLAEQRPSESRSGIGQPLLDARLDGGAISVEGSRQYDTWAARYRILGSEARLKSLADETPLSPAPGASRAFGSVDGAIAVTQRWPVASVTESVAGAIASGRSVDKGFTRGVMSASLTGGWRGLPQITVDALYGEVNAGAGGFERFALGGSTPLLARDLLPQRVAMPALPTGVSIGSSAFTYRAGLGTDPFSVYYWAGSTAPARSRFSQWQRVVGVDWLLFQVPSLPLAGTPAARLRAGAGKTVDGAIKGRVRAYISLTITP